MKDFFKKYWIGIFVVVLVAGGWWLIADDGHEYFSEDTSNLYPISTAIFPDGAEIVLEVADTQETRTLGLGERDFLAEDSGMLFTYLEPDSLGFWMKGMRFPIDIIWLLDGEIVSISRDAQTEIVPTTIYRADSLANQVIEVNAGFSDEHGLVPGDRVDIITEKR